MTSETRSCAVYKREYCTDLVHDGSEWYWEIWDPVANLIITVISEQTKQYRVLPTTSPPPMMEVINSLTDRTTCIANLHRMEITLKFLEDVRTKYELEQSLELPDFENYLSLPV